MYNNFVIPMNLQLNSDCDLRATNLEGENCPTSPDKSDRVQTNVLTFGFGFDHLTVSENVKS